MTRAAWMVSEALLAIAESNDQPGAVRAFMHGPHGKDCGLLHLLERDSSDPMQPSLVIRDESVCSTLFGKVPVRVGGTAAYQDEVEVTGVLRRCPSGSGPAEIISVKRMVLFRDGERFDVI
jgi:hypothetical protein